MVGIPGPPYRNSLMGNLCSIFWSLTMIVFPPHQTLTLSPWATMPGSIVRILGTTSRASFFTHPPLYPQHLSFTTYSHFISSPHSLRSTPIISKLPASLIFTHILPRLWSSVSNSQIIKKKIRKCFQEQAWSFPLQCHVPQGPQWEGGPWLILQRWRKKAHVTSGSLLPTVRLCSFLIRQNEGWNPGISPLKKRRASLICGISNW